MAKYTKKEKMLIDKKIDKLERFYAGIVSLKKKPDAVFIVDAKKDKIAKEEALQTGVSIIRALVNSDSDIRNIDYSIVANDAARSSVKFFTEAIATAFKQGAAAKTQIKIYA